MSIQPSASNSHPPFTLLYQDHALVVIDKPSGWLVHKSEIDRHETRIVVQALRNQLNAYVYPAHRLDKGTSGCLVVALSSAGASSLGKQFEEHSVDKTYLAVARGYMPDEGLIDHPLSKLVDERSFNPDASVQTQQTAQQAQTQFKTLATVELPIAVEGFSTSRYSLVQLKPFTGRQHQLRRHLKHVSHPIIGDSTYGRGRHNRMFADRYGESRLLLACTQMGFLHPESGLWIQVRAPLNGVFAKVISDLFGQRFLDV